MRSSCGCRRGWSRDFAWGGSLAELWGADAAWGDEAEACDRQTREREREGGSLCHIYGNMPLRSRKSGFGTTADITNEGPNGLVSWLISLKQRLKQQWTTHQSMGVEFGSIIDH